MTEPILCGTCDCHLPLPPTLTYTIRFLPRKKVDEERVRPFWERAGYGDDWPAILTMLSEFPATCERRGQ